MDPIASLLAFIDSIIAPFQAQIDALNEQLAQIFGAGPRVPGRRGGI